MTTHQDNPAVCVLHTHTWDQQLFFMEDRTGESTHVNKRIQFSCFISVSWYQPLSWQTRKRTCTNFISNGSLPLSVPISHDSESTCPLLSPQNDKVYSIFTSIGVLFLYKLQCLLWRKKNCSCRHWDLLRLNEIIIKLPLNVTSENYA